MIEYISVQTATRSGIYFDGRKAFIFGRQTKKRKELEIQRKRFEVGLPSRILHEMSVLFS